MTSREMAKVIVNALEDKKGANIRVIDITNVSVIADYFIIADGSNKNQVQALADNVSEELYKNFKVDPKHIEGYSTGGWILMDYNDVIVHIFDSENRLFYDLERIWRDGKVIETDEI